MNANGKRPLVIYLLGIIQALVLLAGTYWIGRVEGLQAQVIDHDKRQAEMILRYESRITALEERYKAIEERLVDGKIQLDRIEALLEKEHHATK